MVYELDAFSKPRLVFLIVELVQVAILLTTHKNSAVLRANDGCHLDIRRDREVCCVKFDRFPRLVVHPSLLNDRGANQEDGYGSTYDEHRGDVVDENAFLRWHKRDMGNDVGLVEEGRYFLSVSVSTSWAASLRAQKNIPVNIVPQKEFVVDGYPDSLDLNQKTHVGCHTRAYRGQHESGVAFGGTHFRSIGINRRGLRQTSSSEMGLEHRREK